MTSIRIGDYSDHSSVAEVDAFDPSMCAADETDPIAEAFARNGDTFRYGKPRQVIDSGFVMTPELREQLDEITAGSLDAATRQPDSPVHPNQRNVFPPRHATTGEPEALVEVSHPLVRTHARTQGRALFIDLDRAKHVVPLAMAFLPSLAQLQQNSWTRIGRLSYP